jgi:glutamyl-tRNA reductase
MPIFAVGSSYRSAPMVLLERLAIDPERRPKALAQLLEQEQVREAVILSTCNRVELYTVVGRFHEGGSDVRRFLAQFHGVDGREFADHLYTYYEEGAVRHLFAVASGIDSMVVGEAQILGQVREAFQAARAERAAGPVLTALFNHAIKVGRRARAETAIGAGLASTLSVGLRVVGEHLGGLAGKRVLIVGAGKMARLAGTTLRQAGVGELAVANRTPARAAELARALGGRSLPLDGIEGELAAADLLVASTAAVVPTVGADLVARAVARRPRGGRPLVVLDLGVPRDVDPEVRSLPGVVLADLDALRAVLETEDGAQRREVDRVRALIAAETTAFITGQRGARLAPTIRALRARAEQIRQGELARVARRLDGLDERQRAAVEAVTRGLVNKLLHQPMVRGKALAAGPDGQLYATILRQLYGLDDWDEEPQ